MDIFISICFVCSHGNYFMKGEIMIQIKNVFFGYTTVSETLHNICLTVKKGECILLCGESGCGKTTVTKLINGLIPHFTEGCNLRGTVKAAELSTADTELYELAKHIGSVFQNPKSQFFNLDTDSEIAFGLENQGVEPEYMKQRLAEVVKNLKIDKLINRRIFSLSGGEKQMLAFASVYAMNPEIYVLDEPTANLDVEAIERLREQIILLKKQGRTVLIAEHRLYFIADLIDRAVYFREGHITEIFSEKEFQNLTEQKRKALGLRTLIQPEISLPKAREDDGGNGLMVEDLSCGYKKEANVFENLSFAAIPGEILAITGHNGTGKTTLIRCLCGLLKERTGTISLYGKTLKPKNRLRESFLVMQDTGHQLFYDSVWNECEQASGKTISSEEIESVLDKFDLLEYKEHHPMALSGGQKQRLAVAAATLSGKNLMIFDEPTSGLDYRHMQEVSAVIRDLAKQGHIILVVSHDNEFITETCDRILKI